MIATVAINNQSAAAIQTTNTAHASSTSGLNRVYWFRRRQISAEPRPHKKSTKILGFGIFMVGVVVLSVSLIIGIEFPLYVSKKILKEQCILEKKHILYDNWFEERGPYVYIETQRKLNVIFSNQRLSYQTWKTQTFHADLTRAECGTTCTMGDSVKVLNTELLQKLYIFGGWDNYMKARVSHFVKSILNDMLQNYPYEDVYRFLGCVNESCSISTGTNASGNVSVMTSLAFGAFVRTNDTDAKRTLLGSDITQKHGYLNTQLVKSVYTQISTPATVTPKACLNGTLNANLTSTWTVFVPNTIVSSLPKDFQNLYNKSSSNRTIYLSRDRSLPCAVLTLVTYLQNFVSWSSVVWTLRVCDTVSGSIHCDEIQDLLESVLALVSLVGDFAGDVLLNLVADIYKLSPENNIVWTKRQHDLIRGYSRSVDDSDPYNVQSVAGLLDHHTDFVDAYRRSPVITVSTCLDGPTTDNNMVIREYNGSDQSPEGVYSGKRKQIDGRTSCFPPSDTCRACAKSSPNSESYEVFTEELQRSLTYTINGKKEIQNIPVYEFAVTDDDLRKAASCGLINVTLIRNYPAFVGNPYYIHSNCEYAQRHTQSFRREALSHITEEPLTGRFWEQSTRLQTSVRIPSEYLGSVVKPNYKDISHVDQPLPVYWVDSKVDIVQDEIDTFKSKIDHLMSVACGGLIGLTLVSVLIMGLSIFVGMMSNRKNKIQPVEEEGQTVPE